MSATSKGEILLSFDDHFTESWVEAIPLLAEYSASVTFFIDQFSQLSTRQLDDLHHLVNAGHEIGCHGVSHAEAPASLAALGPEGFLAHEIEPDIRSMQQHGFSPRAYAYPRSRRCDATDAVLWRRFACLRSGWTSAPNASQSFDDCFAPRPLSRDRRLLIGKSIDDGAIADRDLDAMVARASDTSTCLALYAHAISDRGPHHHLSPRRLEHLLKSATRRGIRFTSICESI